MFRHGVCRPVIPTEAIPSHTNKAVNQLIYSFFIYFSYPMHGKGSKQKEIKTYCLQFFHFAIPLEPTASLSFHVAPN